MSWRYCLLKSQPKIHRREGGKKQIKPITMKKLEFIDEENT
jgi:hypothetical protein